MKEKHFGINISFYSENIDKLYKLQQHLCGIQMDTVVSLISTIYVYNQYLQTSLW